MYPVFLIIDADERRAQRLARLLALNDYRPYVASTPYQALERVLQESVRPEVILLGQAEIQRHHLFERLMSRVSQRQRREIPILPLSTQLPDEPLLYADASNRSVHVFSSACVQELHRLWTLVPSLRRKIVVAKQTLVLDKLPALGFTPRVSLQKLSRNSHFLQILQAASLLIGQERWEQAIADVGLAQYARTQNWPADNEQYAIPADYVSYLHQAVAFSRAENAGQQLRKWSRMATEISLKRRRPSSLTQQALKLLPQERVMRLVLSAFVNQMNDIRGEEVHTWLTRPEGGYWLVHYSNLYAYGRFAFVAPTCHVWLASLESTLQMMELDTLWEVSEKECSCQTLTGHCVFEVKPR